MRRGVRRGASPGRARPAVGRVLRLPLVPRDGPRVVRGRAHRRADERAFRQHQGGPRGASRHRCGLHGSDAGPDRSGWVADDGLPRPRRASLPGGHVLPPGGPRRDAFVHGRAARCGSDLARGPGASRRGRAPDPRGARTSGSDCRRASPRPDSLGRHRCGGCPGCAVRRSARGFRGRAEVPAVDGARVPAAHRRPDPRRGPAGPQGAGDGRRHDAGHGARRDVRPAGGGVRALQRGRRLGRSALREDALRQRPAPSRLPALVARNGRPACPADRDADRAVPHGRPTHLRGRIRVRARRGQRGAGGRLLRLDPTTAGGGARPRGRCLGRRPVRRHAGWNLRAGRVGAPAPVRSRRPGTVGLGPLRAARRAAHPGATGPRRQDRRRPGTAWRSLRWPRRAPSSTSPTGPPQRSPAPNCSSAPTGIPRPGAWHGSRSAAG